MRRVIKWMEKLHANTFLSLVPLPRVLNTPINRIEDIKVFCFFQLRSSRIKIVLDNKGMSDMIYSFYL